MSKKRSTIQHIILLLLIFSAIACDTNTVAVKSKTTFQTISENGILRVGYFLAKPWVYKDPRTGDLHGTNVDLIREIAKHMNVRLEFVEATFATFIAGLQTHKYDISICPAFSTIPRAKSVAFTRPLMFVGNSAIVRKGDSRFRTLEDIDKKGIVVAVTQGEAGHEYAKTHFTKATIKVLSVADQALTFSEVLTGRSDVALGDAWFTYNFASNHPQANDLFADNPYNLTPVAWSVRYSDLDLLIFLNTCLDYLESTGKMDEIDKRYDAKWLRPKKVWKVE